MPATKPPQFRRRAVDLARSGQQPVAKVASDLGISESCLRRWMAQDDVDAGRRELLSSDERRGGSTPRGQAPDVDMAPSVGAVLDAVTELYLDLGPEWTAAAGKDEAALIGHAWFVRTHETAHGAMLLHENDLTSEAAPLRRSMLEHALNIYWLANSPDNGYDAVIKAHQFRTALLAENMPEGWRIESEIFQQIADLKVPNSPEQNLLGFKALCGRYGSPDLYEAWLAETSESHPSWLSGVPYMGAKKRDRGTLTVMIAMYLVMAAEAFSRLLEGDPWAGAVQPLLSELKGTLQSG